MSRSMPLVFLPVVAALLPALPLRAGRATAAPRMAVTAAPSSLQPLFSFSGVGAEEAIEKWERIDDVIMGGVSNSRLRVGGDCAYFEGRLRELGGGLYALQISNHRSFANCAHYRCAHLWVRHGQLRTADASPIGATLPELAGGRLPRL